MDAHSDKLATVSQMKLIFDNTCDIQQKAEGLKYTVKDKVPKEEDLSSKLPKLLHNKV